jgi:hypothetical protein
MAALRGRRIGESGCLVVVDALLTVMLTPAQTDSFTVNLLLLSAQAWPRVVLSFGFTDLRAFNCTHLTMLNDLGLACPPQRRISGR